MARRHRRKSRTSRISFCISVVAIAVVLLVGIAAAHLVETKFSVEVENAGKQMTASTNEDTGAQVFMNGQWYEKKDVETLLVMGIDNFGSVTSSESYNNSNQADFFVLFIRDNETGETKAIHINRDTMTDVTVLGVTGQEAGMRCEQLALSYSYGSGEEDSCRNAANAVSRLLYGMEIDHYITVTMNAVPVLNDWMGGVEIEILDDFSNVDQSLTKGKTLKLTGEQALTYVRSRKGMEDSSNLSRMERQRQYANAWFKQAKPLLESSEDISKLVVDMSDYHYSDCTAEELAECANWISTDDSVDIFELDGEVRRGDTFIEFYVDEAKLQNHVLELFYQPVS